MTEPGQPEAASRPLKIVRVIARLNVGGPARHVVLLGREMRARGHDTLLVYGITGPGEASFEHLAESEGLRLCKLAELGPRLNLLRDARAFFQLLRIIFRESPDVIHSHTAKAGTLARLGGAVYNSVRARHRRALLVHTFHGHVLDGYFGRVGNLAVRFAERSLGRLTDCVVAISPGQFRDLVERFKIVPASRAAMIPIALDLRPFLSLLPSAANLRAKLGLSSSDRVVGYVGRFVPIKDLRTLVHAFARVAKAVPNSWLLLVGDGPLRGDVESTARTAGVYDRVRMVGWTDDLPATYAAMDLFVLSSLNEGTPVAVIEAMAAALPVVATHVGGVPDVIEHRRTGILVPPRRTDLLADAIVDVLQNRDVSRVMGQAARKEVALKFSPASLGDNMNHLYRARLMSKRRS